jgi:hypothetical protein
MEEEEERWRRRRRDGGGGGEMEECKVSTVQRNPWEEKREQNPSEYKPPPTEDRALRLSRALLPATATSKKLQWSLSGAAVFTSCPTVKICHRSGNQTKDFA